MAKLVKPIKIHGGKDYLAPKIVAMFPRKFLTLCEPYAGGCSVMLASEPEGHSEVINDLDGELINFWRVLQNDHLFAEFCRKVQATPFSEEVFRDAGKYAGRPSNNRTVHHKVERAWYFFIRCRQSLSGRRKSFAAISIARIRRGMNEQVSAWLTAIDGLPDVHRRLKRVCIINRDAIDVIKMLDAKETLFYCDPPYLHETRSTVTEYDKYEMSAEQHRTLLETLAGIKGKFLLSGYRSALYDVMAKAEGWKCKQFNLPNNSSKAKTKERMVECVWANY